MSDLLGQPVKYAVPDFDSLIAKFRSAETLPDLPASAIQLCDAIDNGNVGTNELEKIILSDPAITAGVLRSANSALYGGKTSQASTVKGALLLLGHKSIRCIAVSVWVQALVHQSKSSPRFNPGKFAEHSMFVGFLSKYLLSSMQSTKSIKTKWSPDEMFAAGVLHDLGLGLLASIDSNLYDLTLKVANLEGSTFHAAFERVMGRSLDLLSVAAAQAWKLPDLFIDVLMGYNEPLSASDEVDALCCLHYADYLANRTGYSLHTWRVEMEVDPRIMELVGLSHEDIADVLELVSAHTKEFVTAA